MKNNNSISSQEEKKPSAIWIGFKTFLSITFPIFKMLSLNRLLKVCERTLGNIKDKKGKYIDPYGFLPKQRRKNLIMSLVSVTPLLIGVFIGYLAMSTNPILVKGYEAAKREAKQFHLIEAKKKVSIAIQIDPTVKTDFYFGVMAALIGLLTSNVMGYIIVYRHPILKETEKLKNHLAKSGYIKLEENPTVLATPIGVLIDITGNTPREIADSDRVWIPLNVKVNKDWAENPDRRSLVFFKFSYELKPGAAYGFTQIPKE